MTGTPDETQIRTLIENWTKAARDEDMDGVLAQHVGDIVMFDLPTVVRSRPRGEL